MVWKVYLLILVAAFVGIVVWVFDRKRKARFEANARIPLDEKGESHADGKRTRSKIR
jgi:cytochrome c oxidase cbb3-type subunit IV